MRKTIEDYSLAELMQIIEKALGENTAPIEGVKSIYRFDITDEEAGSFQLQLDNGQVKVTQDSDATADCTLVMSLKSFRQFLLGKLNGTMAFMTGKLKVHGDLTKAMKIEAILRQYDINDYL